MAVARRRRLIKVLERYGNPVDLAAVRDSQLANPAEEVLSLLRVDLIPCARAVDEAFRLQVAARAGVLRKHCLQLGVEVGRLLPQLVGVDHQTAHNEDVALVARTAFVDVNELHRSPGCDSDDY